MKYLSDLKSQEFVRTIGGLALAGVTWDDAIAELRVTLDGRSSPLPLHAQVAARLQELIETGGQPLALMQSLVPVHVARLARAELQRHGLYELLRAAAAVPKAADEVIGARSATAEEAEILGIKRGVPVLTMTRTAWNADGRGIEYGSHVYRADRYAFHHPVRAEDGLPAGAPRPL